jgi:hypothetical protein
MTSISPEIYQMVALKVGLRAYARHKMIMNRCWTPKRMMAAAARLCEQSFKARDYEGAAKALERKLERLKEEHDARVAVARTLGMEFSQTM